MDPSGFLEARIGSSPHGQGLKTTLAQLIADEIGVAPKEIRVVAGDTDRCPYGWGTFASRSLVIAGGACKLAAATLRERLQSVAGQILEAAASDIEIGDGRAFVRGTDLGVEVGHLARAAYHQSHRFPAIAETGLSAVATYDPYGTFSNACHIAIVAVDIATGQVEIERFVVVEDAGRLINPMIVEGQIHGGVAQGIANALYEKVVYDDGGNILTGSLADYLVPTMAEIPRLEIHHLRDPDRGKRHWRQGCRRGRHDRRASGGAKRGFRRTGAVWRRYLRNADHPAADLAVAARGGVRSAMSDRQDVTFTVNGEERTIRVEPRRSLADALREDCGLTGTHLGCEHGVCGACTVLVDDQPVRSCLVFALQTEGARIRTVEGLAIGDKLHPLQQAFWDHHGLQCGFCTPGFLMLAIGVLERKPDIAEPELREALSSNLCRCTGYQNILKSVLAAAAEMRK